MITPADFTMKLKPYTVKLLRRIKRQIIKEPKQFRMTEFTCGTAACIYGWGCAITLRMSPTEVGESKDKMPSATTLFKITEHQANALVWANQWPEEFNPAFSNSGFDAFRPEKRARLAAARIEHFIKTGGK